MGIKQFGNIASTFGDKFVRALGGDSTGTDAVLPDPGPSGLVATGGVITDYLDGGRQFRLHTFAGIGSFTVSSIGNFGDTVDYVVIGGGGGAGIDPPGSPGQQGGGGAGGYRSSTPEGPGGPNPTAEPSFTVATFPTFYTVQVGAGGASRTAGGLSYFGPPALPTVDGIQSEGGALGGGPRTVGGNGANGGGGSRSAVGGLGNREPNTTNPVPNQGHDGGDGGGTNAGGGGGGGGAGTPGPTSVGGLAKRTEISGPSYSIGFPSLPSQSGLGWFAGGGGGGGNSLTDAQGNPLGPGGGGGIRNNPAGGAGAQNSGGGGGGRSGSNTGPPGGSGAVFIRYEVALNQPIPSP